MGTTEAVQVKPVQVQATKKALGTPFGRMVQRINELDRYSAAERAVVKFLAPKRLLPSPQELAVLETAKVSMHDVNGILLKTYVWTNMPGSPYVLMSHGFMMSTGSMLRFVQPLLKAGFSVVAWDQPGHGHSEGESTFVQSWSDAFPTIAQAYTPLAGIIGFSLSGTTALKALSENSNFQCPLLVCINSPRQVDTVMKGFLHKHGCSPDLLPMMHDAAAFKGWYLPAENKCFMSKGEGLPNTRFLFVQDQNDRVASEAEVKYWMSKVRDSRLEMTAGLGHQGILGRDQWITKIVEFLDAESQLQRTYRSRI